MTLMVVEQPQLNREQILAAVTDFVFGRTHESLVLVVVVVTVATLSSTVIHGQEIGGVWQLRDEKGSVFVLCRRCSTGTPIHRVPT